MDENISKLGFIEPLMLADALLVQKEAGKEHERVVMVVGGF